MKWLKAFLNSARQTQQGKTFPHLIRRNEGKDRFMINYVASSEQMGKMVVI